ncbi:hypothetical protein GCK72_004661 [Caenorhabditis remanei]|uniref:Uncharacterized protein n=1 Tax=Caenorhabditis remanei TaxID=31234 RepID=A0A6A5HCR5_CAERE|nr:hypothetical protein GCK72_004661 [Caenorhabditis remanei]KAF1764711.1 hypothetical protein GCK72_004661 [Caenorhabditis remanei]
MNWTETYIKCPEIHFNFWNLSLEALCLAGVYMHFVFPWNRFCETHIYPRPYERPFHQFLFYWFSRLIPEASLLLSVIFALLTLCRLTKIGRGEGLVSEEDRELAVVLGLTNSKIRRSILCMLMVYLTFVILFATEYTFRPASLEMFLKKTIQQRNSRKWKIDMLNVVFFLSRMIIYRMFCGKDQMVVEYAPNALIYF